MALYEHVFISRQDLTTLQTEDLIKQYSDILKENGGKVIGHEYWGLRTLAYKINKSEKLPEELEYLLDKDENFEVLKNNTEEVKQFIKKSIK